MGKDVHLILDRSSCVRITSLFIVTTTLLAGADGGAFVQRLGVNPVLRHTARAEEGPSKLPAGLNLVDWKQITAEYERHRHGMFPDGKGGYQSRSHYHGWLARFDGKGFTVKPDGQPWSWGLELASWGPQGQEISVSGVASMHANVNRMEYRWPGITEWFVNGKEGVEQGFTIPSRPAGKGENLVLRLRVRGGLVAADSQDGAGILFRTADGASALHYRKLVVSDAKGRRVPARMMARDRTVQIAVDDRRAVYPLTVDPIVQQAYLKASNTGSTDQFGYSVAISGDTVVVGARWEDSNATGVGGDQSNNVETNAGAAYVFVRSGSTWSQQAYLKASNTGLNDYFGWSVSISGNTVVVGANRESSNATGVGGDESNNSAGVSGAAYVFVRTGTTWSQQAYLKASNTGGSDNFGWTVAISGDTVVVGAYQEDSNATGVGGDGSNNSAGDAGAAYVFVRSGSTWSQQAYLKASNTGAGDNFGNSVAISGDTVVVGAYKEDSNATGIGGDGSNDSTGDAGAAYVFVRSGTTWSQQAYLKASNTGAGDLFGNSVAISGDTVVVGAPSEDSNATGIGGDGSNNLATGSGAAYVFVRNGTTWSQQAYLKASNTGGNDQFGYAVSISGETAVVGAYQEDSSATGIGGDGSSNTSPDSGAAYAFVRSGSAWSQQSYVKASNTGTSDYFGYSISISGSSVVVGAHQESSAATGIGGNQSSNSASTAGAAYAFQFDVSLATASNSTDSDGVTGATVLVNAESWLGWTATSNAAWLTITSGASGTGNGTVTYNVAANTTSSSRTGTLTIGGQSFTVTQSAPPPLTVLAAESTIPYNGATTISSNGGYGTGGVTFAVATGALSCSLTGTTLTSSYAGNYSSSCTVTATKAADSDNAAATSEAITITIVRPSVQQSSSSMPYNGTVTLSLRDSFGTGAVTYTLLTGATSCSISGATVTGIGWGNCTLIATKAADGTYSQQTSRATTITVTPASQATLTAAASSSTITYLGTTSLSTTGGSGTGAVLYRVATGGTSCSLAGTTVTGRTPGACTVVATKAGDGIYSRILSQPITITVNKATQATLTAVVRNTGITYAKTTALTTTGGSGTGTVSYAVATGGANCSISGSTLTGTAVGSCTVVATKATDTNYTQASSTAITITVGKGTQAALTAPVATPSTVGYGATAALSSSGGSGTGAVTYSVTSGSTNCSISGTTLTVTAVGNCTVVATKAADSNYNSATSPARTVFVTKGTQATLTAVAASTTIARNATTTLSTTGGSGTGTVRYAITAGGANCTLIGSTLTGKAVGTCTVTATKVADSNYNSATAGVTITVQ